MSMYFATLKGPKKREGCSMLDSGYVRVSNYRVDFVWPFKKKFKKNCGACSNFVCQLNKPDADAMIGNY